MLKTIENKLEKFAKTTGLAQRVTISHGTLYVLLLQPERCDFFHNVIRTFYKDNINPEGGVNMHIVGDEFAFDFVEGDKDNYTGEGDTYMGSIEPLDSIVDTMMDLEADMKLGK
jgi:hypothetical protein